ncbi:NACHT domain-containing protein [Corallococcus exercitus]|uniref:NACHT domain-containing protein n=1 Tax=Corallococcus exercitus TaxID=2316736 RepID=UPI0011C3A58B|nr:hypothetical protein [Corallococcus exercitus]
MNPLEWTPSSLWGTDGMTLEELRSHHAVALLGEPGMGKTVTLKQSLPELQQHCAQSGAHLLALNLASYGSEERLERDLFRNDTVERWKRGTHALHLVLDSFDECHLRIDTVGGIISENLRSLPYERLYLRVACRPAIWPGTFEGVLKELWPDDFRAVELAPLSRDDVMEAARAHGVDPEAFLREVVRRNVTVLAVRPVTLKLLLGAYARGPLPADRWQLYLDGCIHLARENSRSREETRQLQSTLNAEERLAIAARIAALTLLSNRDQIQVSPTDEPHPLAIAMDDLTGGEEVTRNEQPIPVDRDALLEVLDSGLFRAVEGPRRLTWIHRTYEEFLAAFFLHRREIAFPQLRQFLCPPGDGSPGILPQLQGLATWLAIQDSRFQRHLLQLDPRMLLRSDAPALEPSLRAPLLQALLESVRRDPGVDEQQLLPHLPKLAHDGLAPRLREYLQEAGGPAPVLSLALHVARACEERALLPECLALVLDDTVPVELRIQAMDTLRALGGEAPDPRLLPLARLDESRDPIGELRDRVLSWLWPTLLTTAQVFEALHAPSESALMQRTQQAILERLPPEELPIALRWLREHLPRRMPRGLSSMGDELLRRAFAHLGSPEVLDAYCATLWPKVKRTLRVYPDVRNHDEPWEFSWDWSQRSDEERWRVIDGLVACLESPEDLVLVARLKPTLFFRRDFERVLHRAEHAARPDEQVHWARLIECCYPWGSDEPLEAVFRAIEKAPHLRDGFAWLLEATSLKERPPIIRMMPAEQMRDFQDALMARLMEPQESVQRRCEQLVERIERGEPGAWFQLIETMENSGVGGTALLRSWLWRDFPEALKQRTVQAAQAVLRAFKPGDEPWVESADIPAEAACIHEAFNFLAAHDVAGLDALEESVWRHWATLIIASPASASDEQNRLRRLLVERATRHAPVDVMRTLRRRLAVTDWNQYQSVSALLGSLEECWNETLTHVALEVLTQPGSNAFIVGKLLTLLLDRQVPKAQAFAESLLHDREATPLERRADAAYALLVHGPVAQGPTVWSFLEKELELATEVIEKCSVKGHVLARRFEPGLLMDLYLWIERHAHAPPPPEKPVRAWWRDRYVGDHPIQKQIRDELVYKPSPSAEAALERLCRELPGDPVLREKLYHARVFGRVRAWAPPSPREILELVGLQRRRLVRTAGELLDVLLESLERLEQKLHGETLLVRYLWNKDGSGNITPKDELHLSDWVKQHLQDDLSGHRVVVNREVELRPSMPPREGERVDIWVDAIGKQGSREDRITVIIEVKLSKNRELWTAMEHQLAARYLAENRIHHGIYLVGWYACEHWDKTTPHPSERRVALVRARELLAEQARALSRNGTEVRAVVLDTALRAAS